MKFYLGCDNGSWLERVDVPLFITLRILRDRVRWPTARTTWALDSGGFTELHRHGGWDTTHDEYASLIRTFHVEVGGLEWAAPRDWMCTPDLIRRTGLSIAEHQRRTVESVVALRDEGLPVPVIPVLQGWTLGDYMACAERYADVGVDVTDEPLVGIGSIAGRSTSGEVEAIVVRLAHEGIRLHGFGVKLTGTDRYAHALASADSMTWSRTARWQNRPMFDACTHKRCSACLRWALAWREKVLARAEDQQLAFPVGV